MFIIDRIYFLTKNCLGQLIIFLNVIFRRIVRLIALPYYYFFMVDWPNCPKPYYIVAYDLLYIFFYLKRYPDDYSKCRLWEKDRKTWHLFYGSIYNAYPRYKLSKSVQRPCYKILLDDKKVCHIMCKHYNLPVPTRYDLLDSDSINSATLKSIFHKNTVNKLILKPILGRGGKNIKLVSLNNNQIYYTDQHSKNVIFTKNHDPAEYLIEEYIYQHPSLSHFSKSLNTIRMVTFLSNKREVHLIGAYIRFGLFDAVTDNISTGGVAVGINLDSGNLVGYGYDQKGTPFTRHLSCGMKYDGFQIPFWQNVIHLSKKIQMDFSFYRLLGLDIALTKTGPVLIEINASHDNVGLEQKCGPILQNTKLYHAFFEENLIYN